MDRRRLVVGGLGALVGLAAVDLGLVEAKVLPGRTTLHRALGGCGSRPEPPEGGPAATVVDGSFVSAARGGVRVGYTIIRPAGMDPGAPPPVCVALHGRGGGHRWPVEGLALDRFLTHTPTRSPGIAVVTVDGGDAVNWHRRASGDNPLAMITDELLPELGRAGLGVGRIGLLGWSLGGAGALLLASRLGPGRVAAVAASSPAIWTDPSQVAEGTYDGPADFEAHRVDRLGPALAGIALRIDCGDLDPFADAVAAFRATCTPEPSGTITPGCHDEAHWTRQLPAQLLFLADRLTA